MPRAVKDKRPKQTPLAASIEESHGKLKKSRPSKPQEQNGDEREEAFVDARTTRKILQLAQEQLEEINQEENEKSERFSAREPSNEIPDDSDVEQEQEENWSDYSDYEEYAELQAMDPEEQAILQSYGFGEPVDGTQTLSDKIMEKVREFEMKKQGIESAPQGSSGVMLPPKVIEVYSQIGELMSRYRSGRLPRAFKIIPSLKNWKDVLYVTGPETWSNQAVYEGTKLFVSNLKDAQAQWFVREVLFERFRAQIEDTKNLNYHVYRSLKKALYKPAAFFKGFLFPLLDSDTCTLREAVIASSILARISIPALHSAAALLHLAEMDYSSPTSLFIKVLLDKKYALPYKVIDAMVFHFVRFRAHQGSLPVIWHQSFLVFAQRYKNDITEDQRDALMAVVRLQSHHTISPEIRRELLAGEPRLEPTNPESEAMIE